MTLLPLASLGPTPVHAFNRLSLRACKEFTGPWNGIRHDLGNASKTIIADVRFSRKTTAMLRTPRGFCRSSNHVAVPIIMEGMSLSSEISAMIPHQDLGHTPR